MKILLVDDDFAILLVLKMHLVRMGHEVQDFDDPVRAVEAVADFQPDLVISDLQMPVLDGVTLARQVAERATGEAPPVLLMSGHPEAADGLTFVSPSLYIGLLPKPFNPPSLSKVLSMLERARGQCPGTLERLCPMISHPSENRKSESFPTKLCATSGHVKCPYYEESCRANFRGWIKLEIEKSLAGEWEKSK